MKRLEYWEVLNIMGEKAKLLTLKEPLLTLVGGTGWEVQNGEDAKDYQKILFSHRRWGNGMSITDWQ